MKRLTLNKTWTECLRLWKWLAIKKIEGSRKSIGNLKEQWFKENGYTTIDGTCFFCIYDTENLKADSCSSCPGVKIDKDFDCVHPAYHFANHPVKFCLELMRLNKIRLSKKRTKK